MPTISPSLIPSKAPGTLFESLTGGDTTLSVRWLTATDPSYYSVLNRPLADIVVRQLIVAKAVDQLELSLGNQNLYPFLVQPYVTNNTIEVAVPGQWLWDVNISLPEKWTNLRLAKIKRISGANSTTAGYSGKLRLIFTANENGSAIETSIFYADYQIDSDLSYQLEELKIVTTAEESIALPSNESQTVSGFVILRTLNTEELANQTFLDLLAPGNTTDSNSDLIYDNPSVYEISDNLPGGTAVTDDYALETLSHGTGLLLYSAYNSIPPIASDQNSWIVAFNYPFGADASRRSVDDITIPAGLFEEFNITAPAGDEPTGDTSGTFYPVWINRIERLGTGGSTLRFFFSTYNVTDTASGGSPSTQGFEFAQLDLNATGTPGEVLEIVPIGNLLLQEGTDSALYNQHFGRGHVVLSSLWGGTSSAVSDFFDAFDSIVETPADTSFSKSATRLSSFGVSRLPKYTPTVGQSRALKGSTSRLTLPISPSQDNLFVTEADQGAGNTIDLEAQPGIIPNTSIDRYGYSGSLCHKIVKLVIDADSLGSDPNFYENQVLPRLRVLLGRDPIFGDFLFNGSRLLFFNGSTWVG